MDTIRIGIIGMGNMGQNHARNLLDGKVAGAELTAVCDAVKHDDHPFVGQVKSFKEDTGFLDSGLFDAVIIATPHYFHTTQGIAALEAGMHVLVEKPISVHKQDCEKLIAAHTDKSKVFSAMFNQRTDPYYIKVRELIRNGELGVLRRVNWIVTNWFRTEIYYAGGGWRATWKGEGGGVLLNQCPHNLDLLQWLCGPPDRVRAFCHLGKYHDIEVEDDVTAYLEWNSGCTGVFITTTGEAPGTNRLELTGDRGKIVIEHDRIAFTRNETPMDAFSQSSQSGFAAPDTWNVEVPVDGHGPQHMGIVQNWINAIRNGEELISPAEEGIHSVELANAMLYSSLTDQTVDLPLDGAAYAAKLQELIDTSTHVKKVVEAGVEDVSGTFGH